VKKSICTSLFALAALLVPGVAYADYPALPYVDNFNNAMVTVDDNGVNFWSTVPVTLTPFETVQEAGSNEVLTSFTAFGATVVNNTLTQSFNFFNAPLTFGLSGLMISGSASAANQQFVYAVQDSSGTTFGAADSYAAISITGDAHLTLSLKQVGSSFGLETLVNDTVLNSQATGFALTLNGSALTYSLLVNEGANSQTFTGSLPNGFSESRWGPNNNQGASAISFAIYDNQPPLMQGVPDSFATATVDAVMVVPEPRTWAAGGLTFGAMLVSQRRRLRSRKLSELSRLVKRRA
jgi:hypothetical protein